ncbi:uncharacterized protein HMPREF1541_00611 [Cyphellophora europaea CBS 101466]|uniref:RNA-dependent RNA polymerase n=1 Tax=Cyphellophora europaea (strain CBS 101466) TaxID=1220924 RepID=W2SCL8_CYPE1|nr:uncharacterized protein HMPREF1541_00611 [Cyphellophora europaea CBS 101466]ETN46427.1 hypothetical protein HMPREF1541_00611 [Cyphellophora europaea CBS 101466]
MFTSSGDPDDSLPGQGSKSNAANAIQLPTSNNWRTWSVVKVSLSHLPSNVSTADIHKNFIREGNISSIDINQSRRGGQLSSAEIRFKPPPARPFWAKGAWKFETNDRKKCKIGVRLSEWQKKNYTVPSPGRDVVYPEEIVLHGTTLGFGILGKDKEMTVMNTVSSHSEALPNAEAANLSLLLNLRKREIEVHFPILLQSKNGSRTRLYRFPVSLDDNFSIWRLAAGTYTRASYIVHVRNPPWYSRRLETAMSASHVKDARIWREDDLWTRQTDIVTHKDTFTTINETPVALRKNLNRINLARWTTFKFDLDMHKHSEMGLKLFESALQDFNVRVDTNTQDFVVVNKIRTDEAAYWSDIENTGDPRNPLDDGFALSFGLRYQLEVCISNGWLSEYAIDQTFLRKLKMLPEAKAKQMLVHVDAFGEEIHDPMTIFTDIRYQKPVRARQLPRNCVLVYHATVTASGLKIHTPTVDYSNRVVRKYMQHADRFLRVKFEDDEYRGQSKIFASSNKKMQLIIDRVGRALSSGITIAGIHYEFLAYGNSQLREHGAYFFASKPEISASMIRAEMGVFDNETIVAKLAARMGQCFSTTVPFHYPLPPITKDNLIPDIIIGSHIFSDGVGKLSPLAATLVQGNLGISGQTPPSCFQFRLGGCKGVLVVDPSLAGITVQIRRSQFKFESKSQELEIIRWSHFWQPFLNRQIILVLSFLGIKDQVFLNKQKSTIKALEKAMKDDNAALTALRTQVDPNLMTLSMCDLVSNGFRRVKEPFVMSLLELWRAYSLKYLKEKAKIPVSDGAFVLGTVDETNSLRGHFDKLQAPDTASRQEKEKGLPEIFLQITDPKTGKLKVIESVCILARNPSLHPGDIRVVKAVNSKALHHLRDVVVMPQNGDRDLPSMCSGGDLDGDDYIVIWDQTLIPDNWQEEPFHYEPPNPVQAEGEITTKHIIDFFLHYLMNDQLGRIAHAHLGSADFLDLGVKSDDCLRLVQAHSTSVDYPKTGVPAELPRDLERNKWPHFMEKRGHPYVSKKILGQLYDDVKKSVKRFGFKTRYNTEFDKRILHLDRPQDHYFAEVEIIKHEYDMALQRIMAQHKIQTEFEVWSTFVMSHSKQSRDFKFHEEIGRISKNLKDEFRQELVRVAGGNDFDRLMPYALAAYQFTAAQVSAALRDGQETDIDEKEGHAEEEEVIGPSTPKVPFCSFPWILADVLGKIATTSNVGEGTDPSKLAIQVIPGNDSQTYARASSMNHKDLSHGFADNDASKMVRTLSANKKIRQAGKDEVVVSSDNDSYDHVSQDPSSAEPSPIDEEMRFGEASVARLTMNVGKEVMKDPALMTEAEKAALFADEDDL